MRWTLPGTGYDTPILSLYNQVKGKAFPDLQSSDIAISALAPEIYEIDARNKTPDEGLVNEREGV